MDVIFAFPRKTTARPGHVVDVDKVILKALVIVPPTHKNLATRDRSPLHLVMDLPLPAW